MATKKAVNRRDPRRTARNKRRDAMTEQLLALFPKVSAETGIHEQQRLNAMIGHKTDRVLDLKNDVILSPDHYESLWFEGFRTRLEEKGTSEGFGEFHDLGKKSPSFRKYLSIFLKRSYLKHYDELHKARPTVEEAEIWMGQNKSDYGLLVAPRFANGSWENDKSEIRHFRPGYWTIGHALETGFVVPHKPDTMNFDSVDAYLKFFEHVLVRDAGSCHQTNIAERYSAFVRASPDPLKRAPPHPRVEVQRAGGQTRASPRLLRD